MQNYTQNDFDNDVELILNEMRLILQNRNEDANARVGAADVMAQILGLYSNDDGFEIKPETVQ